MGKNDKKRKLNSLKKLPSRLGQKLSEGIRDENAGKEMVLPPQHGVSHESALPRDEHEQRSSAFCRSRLRNHTHTHTAMITRGVFRDDDAT